MYRVFLILFMYKSIKRLYYIKQSKINHRQCKVLKELLIKMSQDDLTKLVKWSEK